MRNFVMKINDKLDAMIVPPTGIHLATSSAPSSKAAWVPIRVISPAIVVKVYLNSFFRISSFSWLTSWDCISRKPKVLRYAVTSFKIRARSRTAPTPGIGAALARDAAKAAPPARAKVEKL